MTKSEAEIMQRHWTRLLAEGSAVVFGPVADPNGAYGIAVIEVRDEVEANRLMAADPAIHLARWI